MYLFGGVIIGPPVNLSMKLCEQSQSSSIFLGPPSRETNLLSLHLKKPLTVLGLAFIEISSLKEQL